MVAMAIYWEGDDGSQAASFPVWNTDQTHPKQLEKLGNSIQFNKVDFWFNGGHFWSI